MRYAAVIFDMDGTLLDTERLIIDAGMTAFARLGLPPRRDVLQAMVGTVGDAGTQLLRAAFGPGFDEARFESAWSLAFETAKADGIPLRPGADHLLGHLADRGIPRAVATNSRTAFARDSLAAAGILYRFNLAHVHGRDRVARPKPAPDLYLHAASVLSVDPALCLVFEDSDPGAEAALAAGMTVVHVPDQVRAGDIRVHHRAESLIEGARAAGLMI